MPELPEVEIIARRLRAALPGRRIVALAVPDARLLRSEEPVAPPERRAAEWQSALTVAAFTGAGRRAKFLLLPLDNGQTLVAHLRMTGKLMVLPPVDVPGVQAFRPSGVQGKRERSDTPRFAARLDDGSRLVFVDPRRLGELWRVPTADLPGMPALARLGPDALEEPSPAARLAALGGRSRQPIKAWLMDQRHLGGLGNICAGEILFRAGLRPDTPAKDLPAEAWDRLATAIPEYLHWAIEAQWEGELKYLGERDALNPFALYRRAGAPCPRCGTPIRRIVVAGRGTYVCPRCQA
jgi:formamidopyrimidine-DNA glycosylase